MQPNVMIALIGRFVTRQRASYEPANDGRIVLCYRICALMIYVQVNPILPGYRFRRDILDFP